MAKKKAKNDTENAKPKKAPRQPDLPGIPNTKRVPELEALFEDFDEAKAKRMAAHTTEKSLYDSVIAGMEDAKVSVYKFSSRDGTTVTIKLKGKKSFTVHKKKPEAFKDGGEDEE